MEKVELKHDKEKLIVAVVVKGVTHYEHITSYFENSNAYDDWLDYRITKKYNDARFIPNGSL